MQRTTIGTFDYSWNPTTGCSKGCSYCYAAAMARRFKRSFAPQCHPERLEQPIRLNGSVRIFVDSAGDLFDPAIPDWFIYHVWSVMGIACRHTYFILTKQAGRMAAFFTSSRTPALASVWLGVSITNQRDADERVPLLLQVPAALRFVSVEPMLGPVEVDPIALGEIGLVIIGAQTGPGAKPINRAWVSALTDQCASAGVPVFHKDSLKHLFPLRTWMRREMP